MIIYENGQLNVIKVDLSYTSTPENGERFVEGEDIDIKLALSNISSSTITGVEISVEEPLSSSWELEQLEADESQDLTDVYPLQSEDEEAGYVDYSIVITYTDSDNQEQGYSCIIRMFNEIVHPSYTTHTWRTGDVVTAPDFNHIENGIIDNSAGLSELSINKLDINSNSDYMTVTGTSDDASSPNAWKSVDVLESGEIHTSIFTKLSKMFSNIRYLYSQVLNKLDKSDVVTADNISTVGKALDATANNPNVNGSLANSLDTLGTDYATFKQAVIDGEVGGSTATIVTQAEYDALSETEKNSDTIYFISDAPFDSPNVVTCTRAEYNAMTDATKMDGRFYYITDDPEVETSLIVDNLTTNDAGYALSAKQGYNLNQNTPLNTVRILNQASQITKEALCALDTGAYIIQVASAPSDFPVSSAYGMFLHYGSKLNYHHGIFTNAGNAWGITFNNATAADWFTISPPATVYTNSVNTTVAVNTWTSGASVTIPAGTYVQIHQAYSTAGTIRCGSSASTGTWVETSSAYQTAQFVKIGVYNASTTIANSLYTATAGTYSNVVTAIRIK